MTTVTRANEDKSHSEKKEKEEKEAVPLSTGAGLYAATLVVCMLIWVLFWMGLFIWDANAGEEPDQPLGWQGGLVLFMLVFLPLLWAADKLSDLLKAHRLK